MFFPESLLRLSQRDLQLTWLDPVFHTAALATAAASHSLTYQVPADRALLLQHVTGQAFPAPTQNLVADGFQLYVADRAVGSSQGIHLWRGDNALGASIMLTRSWQGSLLVPPTWVVGFITVYNAGAAPNATRLWVGGMLVPPANVQR